MFWCVHQPVPFRRMHTLLQISGVHSLVKYTPVLRKDYSNCGVLISTEAFTVLCENTQTDTFTDSKEEISSSPGDLAAVDEQNDGLLKIIKVEEAEEDLGKTTEHRTCLFFSLLYLSLTVMTLK